MTQVIKFSVRRGESEDSRVCWKLSNCSSQVARAGVSFGPSTGEFGASRSTSNVLLGRIVESYGHGLSLGLDFVNSFGK